MGIKESNVFFVGKRTRGASRLAEWVERLGCGYCSGSAGNGESPFFVRHRCFALRARIFKASGSIALMRSADEWYGGRRAMLTRPDLIVAMSPPGYPSARLLPSRAGFRFTRRD